MGKPLGTQRRGKGSPTFRVASHRFHTTAAFRTYDDSEKAGAVRGQVTGFDNGPERSGLLMNVLFEDGERRLLLAPEGIKQGDAIECGTLAAVRKGCVLPLANIPDGTPIYNIELRPGDGGKMVRAAGTTAYVVSHEPGAVWIRLPSRKTKRLLNVCRAAVGVIAGGGHGDKPYLKAGKRWHAYKARGKKSMSVRGVKMSPYDHPFGGKQHHVGYSKTVGRGAPPGRKVGLIAASRTGRRRGKAATEERKAV